MWTWCLLTVMGSRDLLSITSSFFILVSSWRESDFKAAERGIWDNYAPPFSKLWPHITCPSSVFDIHSDMLCLLSCQPLPELTYKQGEHHISQSRSTRNRRTHTARHLLPFHHTAVNRALLLNFCDWQAQAVRLVILSQLRTRKSFWHLPSRFHPPTLLWILS